MWNHTENEPATADLNGWRKSGKIEDCWRDGWTAVLFPSHIFFYLPHLLSLLLFVASFSHFPLLFLSFSSASSSSHSVFSPLSVSFSFHCLRRSSFPEWLAEFPSDDSIFFPFSPFRALFDHVYTLLCLPFTFFLVSFCS